MLPRSPNGGSLSLVKHQSRKSVPEVALEPSPKTLTGPPHLFPSDAAEGFLDWFPLRLRYVALTHR